MKYARYIYNRINFIIETSTSLVLCHLRSLNGFRGIDHTPCTLLTRVRQVEDWYQDNGVTESVYRWEN